MYVPSGVDFDPLMLLASASDDAERAAAEGENERETGVVDLGGVEIQGCVLVNLCQS